jgi:hypothetical protein
VTVGTAGAGAARHPEQATPSSVTASEELTMRHAAVTVHLIHQARAAGVRIPERQAVDAPPEVSVAAERRPRRLAILARRARALVARTT